MAPLSYAVVGGPPDDWHGLSVFDAVGNEVKDVIEVNAAEGWLIRHRRDDQGNVFVEGDEVAKERITGTFTIKRPSEI